MQILKETNTIENNYNSLNKNILNIDYNNLNELKKERHTSNEEIYNIKINLMDLSNLNTKDILSLYKENDKITNYSNIYAFLLW